MKYPSNALLLKTLRVNLDLKPQAGYGLKAAKLAKTSPSPVVITYYPKDAK